MKKAVFLLAIIGAVFTGCNPLEDINNEIDAVNNPVVGSAEYTVTADDYADLDLGYGSFNSEQQAKDSIPQLLSNIYSFWGQGSSVLVSYNLYVGDAEGVSDYTDSDVYSLTNSDYAATGSDAFGFYPNVNATSQIPDVLSTQIANPTEGQIVLAKYKHYTETPVVGLANLIDYNFAGSLEGWNIVETSPETGADDVWVSGTGNVQGNAYFGGAVANEEWLVSPSIDLSGESNLKFQITQEIDYLDIESQIDIMISTDYSGDISTANWTALAFDKTAFGNLTTSPDYDFSAYDGQTINVAFKYSSSDTDAGRWRISDMAIKTIGATGATNSKGEYFMYSGGNWEAVDDIYYLSSADFDAMGTGYGQPGQYNNFSSSVSPNNYLPTFLASNFPYGQEDEELFVIYDYYSSSSGAQRRGNLYTFNNGMWNAHQSTIETSLQFGFDNGVWVPDNTIRYTLVAADYTLASTALLTEPGFEGPAGSMGNYGNFDRRVGNANYWSDEMIVTALDIILDNNDPSALDDQKYIITVDIYNGSNGTEDFSVIKTAGEWVIN